MLGCGVHEDHDLGRSKSPRSEKKLTIFNQESERILAEECTPCWAE